MLKLVALAGVSGALAAEITPVEQVTNLLTDLQAKVVAEGKAEAKTYDAFACFCKDTSKAKTEAIAKNNAEKSSLQGEHSSEVEKRNTADDKIKAKNKRLNELSTELEELENKNQEDKHSYATEIEDIESAVDSLERAIKVLKNSDKDENAFLQVKDTVKTALLMADAMGMKQAKALLQIPDVPVSDYDFHSHGIVKILEDLLVSFRETRTRVNDDETKRIAQYTSDKQANHDDTKANTKALNDAKGAKEAARTRIGAIMGDLTLVEADLSDDQNYLLDLTNKCNDKKAQWDQRSAMRMDELTALTQAVAIIRGGVSKHTTDQTIRFMQDSTSFVQVTKVVSAARKFITEAKKGFMSARSPREQVLELLRAKSQSLKSAVLASLAAHAGADPLAKVKKLIEELVLRLQEEASQEESHNGWCVKQTNLAEDKREREGEKTTTLNTELRGLETRRDKIFETLDTLEKELAQLADDLAKATSIYDDETAQRNQAISDAEAGKAAVESATTVLKDFYNTRAAKPALIQQGPVANNIPDAGFDEEYYGAQDTASGIFGMLEVITSDFVRTIEESKAAQKESDNAFRDFKNENQKSTDEKTILKDDYTNQKVETLDTIRTKNKDLDNAMSALASAVTELLELHEACVAGGMTYEERVAKREDEIEALKQAYGILDNYSA